jgi:hypothetical protein
MLTYLAVGLIAACAGAPEGKPGVPDGAAFQGAPLNPTHEGKPVILGFDTHHPDCFVALDGGDTESVDCSDEALSRLAGCKGGKLYRAKEGDGCVCVPLADEPAAAVDCPAD